MPPAFSCVHQRLHVLPQRTVALALPNGFLPKLLVVDSIHDLVRKLRAALPAAVALVVVRTVIRLAHLLAVEPKKYLLPDFVERALGGDLDPTDDTDEPARAARRTTNRLGRGAGGRGYAFDGQIPLFLDRLPLKSFGLSSASCVSLAP